MEAKEILWELLRSPGAPGQEGAALATAKRLWKEVLPEAELCADQMGNLTAFIGSADSPRQILFDAHMDQIGMVVTSITEEGFLHIAPCGGVDRHTLPGSTVDVYGKTHLTGIICCQPPHLSTGKENKIEPVDEMYVDLGLSRDEASAQVSPGDVVLIRVTPRELLGSRVTGAGLDNRAGAAALLRCGQLLSNKRLDCGVTFLFSTREETGCEGAKTAAYRINPTHAVVVDVSFARQPGVPAAKSGKLGEGMMIGRSPSLDAGLTRTLIALAEQHSLAYQQEVMGGRTGTNADVIGTSRGGVRTGLVSIPLRSMHTPAEIIDLRDLEQTAQLLAAYVQEGGGQDG